MTDADLAPIDRRWLKAIRMDDLVGRLMQEMIRVDHSPVRSGQRPVLDGAKGHARLRAVLGDDVTLQPFHVAFQALAGPDRSARGLAELCGLRKSRLQYLRNGERPPTVLEMEVIAAAFGKRPDYFHEYRRAQLLAAVKAEIDRNPERGAVIHQRIAAHAAAL